MLAYVGLSCGQRGPILWLCWPMFASCWPMLSQKIRKMGTAKKRCKTQDILMVGGLSWGYVGPSWGYVGLSWGQCGPILGLCWPILGLCWPILGAMLAHVVAMLAHLEAYVGPCWPILNHKIRKMGKNGTSTKHRKTRRFLAAGGVCGKGRRPLSPTERRETPSARTRPGGPWPDLGAYARQPARGPTMWAHFVAMLAYVGLCWPMLAYRAGNTCVSALPTATLLVSSWSWLSFCTASVQAGVQGPCRRAKTPWQWTTDYARGP